MYFAVFREKGLFQSKRCSSWTPWNFIYPKDWDFGWAEKILRWKHFQDPSQHHVPRKREIMAVVEWWKMSIVYAVIWLLKQVRLVHVWIRWKYWTGRGWHYSWKGLCTIQHPEENVCSLFSGILQVNVFNIITVTTTTTYWCMCSCYLPLNMVIYIIMLKSAVLLWCSRPKHDKFQFPCVLCL